MTGHSHSDWSGNDPIDWPVQASLPSEWREQGDQGPGGNRQAHNDLKGLFKLSLTHTYTLNQVKMELCTAVIETKLFLYSFKEIKRFC